MDKLLELGWNDFFSINYTPNIERGMTVARVSCENRNNYHLLGEFGEATAQISGSFRYDAKNKSELPAVGDWVVASLHGNADEAVIHKILPRRTSIVRKAAGDSTVAQIISANVDTVFIMSGLDDNYNLRRIERYLSLVWHSDAIPVVVLNKSDLLLDPLDIAAVMGDMESIALGVPVHFISALEEQGIDELSQYLVAGNTLTLLGSSGVGKSTLTNRLLGNGQQKTAEIRADDSRGRHTTTRRELFVLPGGGVLIDTPGMRELQLWVDDQIQDLGFVDIEQLAEDCKFSNCSHDNEPSCMVNAAIAAGDLDPKRLANFNKMKREIEHLESRQKEVGWDVRLKDKTHGKLRHKMLKDKRD